MNITGLAVSSRNSATHPRAASSMATALAGSPASRAAHNVSKAAMAAPPALGFALASRRRRAKPRSTVSRSASASSVSITATSSCGDTLPATWATSVPPKQRTTWAMAWVSRMWPRKRLPSPSPFDAPATRPAMSTNSVAAGTTRADFARAPMRRRRSSHTGTDPTLRSMVQNGKLAASAPALVSALNSVDLPTFGSPTMPQRKPISRRPPRRSGRAGATSPGPNRRSR